MGPAGGKSKDPRRLVALIHALALTTPQRVNMENSRASFPQLLQKFESSIERMDAIDYVRQAQAMIGHDITASHGGTLESVAPHIRAQVLVVVGTQDHMVTPGPARRLAKLLKAQMLELTGDCGHIVTSCEMGLMGPVVRNFIAR
jgi:homoserine O-acetyltransferase